MSTVLCDHCSRVIDSDFDIDCFVEVLGFDQSLIACSTCRDRMEESGELDVENNRLRIDKGEEK